MVAEEPDAASDAQDVAPQRTERDEHPHGTNPFNPFSRISAVLLLPSDFVLLACFLLGVSAVFFFRARAVIAHFQFARPVWVLVRLGRAYFPLWFAREVLDARIQGRSTRLVRKRYRSLRRRALRRSVEQFFQQPSEPGPWHRQQFAFAVLCLMAGFATVFLTAVETGAFLPH